MAISTPPRQRRRPWSRPEPPHPTVMIAETSLLLSVIVIVMVVIFAIVAFVAIQGIGRRGYQATIENITPYGSSQVAVDFQVSNLGASPARPTCEIDVSSSASAFTGSASFTPSRPIPGSSSTEYWVMIRVTPDGATHVNGNSSSVGCQ